MKCVRLTTASYKARAYHNKHCINTRNQIFLTFSETAKSLFDVNYFVNTPSNVFKSKSIEVIVRSRRKHARVLRRSINLMSE